MGRELARDAQQQLAVGSAPINGRGLPSGTGNGPMDAASTAETISCIRARSAAGNEPRSPRPLTDHSEPVRPCSGCYMVGAAADGAVNAVAVGEPPTDPTAPLGGGEAAATPTASRIGANVAATARSIRGRYVTRWRRWERRPRAGAGAARSARRVRRDRWSRHRRRPKSATWTKSSPVVSWPASTTRTLRGVRAGPPHRACRCRGVARAGFAHRVGVAARVDRASVISCRRDSRILACRRSSRWIR
jgi:hypothetical protein